MSKPPSGFARYKSRAAKLISSPDEVLALSAKAADKLANTGSLSSQFQAVRDELGLLVAMLKAWVSGDYRQVSTGTIVAIATAVLYFVMPFDLIPDFIVGIGLLDDAAVIAYVAGLVHEEITDFENWRSGKAASSPDAGDP